MSDMRAWMDPTDGHVSPDPWGSYTRRALVIDPENDEHVRALVGAMREHGWTGMDDEAAGDMRNVLRSLLAPPKTKPAEPNEHGAKVIDEGMQWVAFESCRTGPYRWLWSSPDGRVRTWAGFSSSVEVLP